MARSCGRLAWLTNELETLSPPCLRIRAMSPNENRERDGLASVVGEGDGERGEEHACGILLMTTAREDIAVEEHVGSFKG